MTKRLDVSTLTLTVRPVTDHSGFFRRKANAAILRGWLFINVLALLRNAQRQTDKITDENTSISVQLTMRTRLNKPVVTQENIVKDLVDAKGKVVGHGLFDLKGNFLAEIDIKTTQQTGPIVAMPTMEVK